MRKRSPQVQQHSFSSPARNLQPPLPDGSFLMPVNDPVDSLHSEHAPESTLDRHREAVILDRLFWASIATLMIVGVGLRIWVLF